MNAPAGTGALPPGKPRLPVVPVLAIFGLVIVSIFIGRRLRTRSVAAAAVNLAQTPTGVAATAPLIGRGEIVFLQHCVKCHGPDGHGDPDAIERQKPPPRDFAARPWRFEVTRDSIRQVIAQGIPSTAMPGHQAALSSGDLEAVVNHTLQLATAQPLAKAPSSPLEASLTNVGFYPQSPPRLAPDLVLSNARGHKRSLADERGRIVLLNFWGTSCEHCLTNMPKLEGLAERWRKKGLIVMNICADAENAQAAQELIARVSPTSIAWVDDTGLANAQFEVQALPTLWLIDRSGELLASSRGMKDWQAPEVETLISLLTSQAVPRP